MSFFEKCLSVVMECGKRSLSETNDCFKLMERTVESSPNGRYDTFTVYYISDIHLEHHIYNAFPCGASDEQVENYITKIVSDLLCDSITSGFQNKTVLFGGDIASDYMLSRLFFSKFIEKWNEKNRKYHQQKRSVILSLIQEQDNVEERISEWKKNHKWTQTAAKDLLEYSDKRVPIGIKELLRRNKELKQLIFLEVGIHRDYYSQEWRAPEKKIYAVIGNHEFWPFETIEKCINAYQSLFDDLRIVF